MFAASDLKPTCQICALPFAALAHRHDRDLHPLVGTAQLASEPVLRGGRFIGSIAPTLGGFYRASSAGGISAGPFFSPLDAVAYVHSSAAL